MSSYLKGDRNVQIQGAEFLHGLFNAARDIIMTDDSFIRMTDTLICGLDYDDFIEILPSMKLAFSCFTPMKYSKQPPLSQSFMTLTVLSFLWKNL